MSFEPLYIPDLPISPPEPDERNVFCHCDNCDEPIYSDDAYYRFGSIVRCEECVENARHYAP